MSGNSDGTGTGRRHQDPFQEGTVGHHGQQISTASSLTISSPQSEVDQNSLSTTPRQSHITAQQQQHLQSTAPRHTSYQHHSLPRSQEGSALSASTSPSAAATARARRDESWASAADESGAGSSLIGRGYPSRPSTYGGDTRYRGYSAALQSRDMSTSNSGNLRPGSNTAGGPPMSNYAPSDFEGQSVSGLSASELDADDSADETAPSQRVGPRASRSLYPGYSGQKKPSASSSRRPVDKQRRPSNVAGTDRSQSRSRRASVAVGPRADYLDDLDTEGYGPYDDEDDEVVPHDRGEELVRRRMKARQKEKRRREKESEKKKILQQQRGEAGSPAPPGSPRKHRNISTTTARPVSPTPQSPNALHRDGRPTFINLPASFQGDEMAMLSPGPATSPGPVRPGYQGLGLGQGVPQSGNNFPSPNAHIRRPSSTAPNQGRRVSGFTSTSGQQSSTSRITQPGGARTGGGTDFAVETGPASDIFAPTAPHIDAKSSVAGGSIAGGDDIGEENDPDEGRDTVADLRARAQASGSSKLPQAPEDEGDQEAHGSAEDGDEGESTAEVPSPEDEDDDSTSTGDLDPNDVEYTLKDRQDAINIEHPFGLPIWKPALYKKSRTVTRNAENALHSIPSRAAERHFLPGNLLWTIFFGVWLSILCAVASLLLRVVPLGGPRYARVLWELGWYLFWPFGKYVEVEVAPSSLERSTDQVPKGQYTFIDQDGGISFEDANEGSYTNAFTPVAARFPHDHEHRVAFNSRPTSRPASRNLTLENYDTIRPGDVNYTNAAEGSSAANAAEAASSRAVSGGTVKTTLSPQPTGGSESSPLKGKGTTRSYGATGRDAEAPANDTATEADEALRIERETSLYEYVVDANGHDIGRSKRWLGSIAYGILFWALIAPVLGVICLACWAFVFTIPMAKLSWVLLKNLSRQPLALHFGSAPVVTEPQAQQDGGADGSGLHNGAAHDTGSLDKAKKLLFPLRPGQLASRAKSYDGRLEGRGVRKSKILLCTYRALGSQYYKYTVGGVNILFVNTLPFVGFTIFDFFFLEPYVKKHHLHSGFFAWVSGQGVIFVCALGSVIPLSYFIGMAVASISAQSSIGMGAVINATFGSIIEIILYGIALTQEKARLVEGSLIGSILAGVLLMPGLSMCSGATRRKEQRFNARSAGVTSTMLIMAIIGILTPTLFYQIYGTFQLSCTGCPDDTVPGQDWTCKRCFYEHVPPATDPFYQENVKGLMYTCTVILVCSYGIGLWFSLRTHASQIWQNPQPAPAQAAANQAQPLHHGQGPASFATGQPHHGADMLTTAQNIVQIPSAQRASIYKRLLPASVMQQLLPTTAPRPQSHGGMSNASGATGATRNSTRQEPSESSVREPPPLRLPESFSQEEYANAMALTASAFHDAIQQHQREQQQKQQQRQPSAQHSRLSLTIPQGQPVNAALPRPPHPVPNQDGRGVSVVEHGGEEAGGHGGHDAPSWSRGVSLTVLISCTVLYAIIAEILVDVVDVVLDGSGIDEKFLGVTLFALVPNTTEFMNAMSFAINGNIALSMEIGSAYALQVCLIQIPAMVAFSAYYNAQDVNGGGGLPGHLIHRSFTLIFPRWDVIAIIFSVFLLTYTYIEARSNYYRGSICILSYLVLVAGFFFAPATGDTEAPGDGAPESLILHSFATLGGIFGGNPTAPRIKQFGGLSLPPLLPELDMRAWLKACLGALWTR